MAPKHLAIGTAAVLGLVAMTGAAQSASLGGMIAGFERATASERIVEMAQYRICAMERGVRRCRMAEISGPYRSTGRRVYGYRATGPRVFGYRATTPSTYGYQATNPSVYGYQGAYPPGGYGLRPDPDATFTGDPDRFPVGSAPWWQTMDTLGRGGHPN